MKRASRVDVETPGGESGDAWRRKWERLKKHKGG